MMAAEHAVIDLDARLRMAEKPAADAMAFHPFYRGKMESALKCPVRDLNDFAIWYTPGVAAPCRAIAKDPERVYDYTNKWNTVAVVSDGTRVLGLGDIGPKAGLPVMEGKALLFKYLGGVDAVAITLDTKDPDELVETALLLQPAFGGVNLEDISQPKCFTILDALREQAEIPVWHDDQQGSATVALAGLMNALRIVEKERANIRIAFIGCGAANVAIARLVFSWGVPPAQCFLVDRKGILGLHRRDLKQRRSEFADKWRYCEITNAEGRAGGIPEAMEGADVAIALSQTGPGVILPEWVRRMDLDPIVFACANPVPEIWPWEAQQGGARIIATGRSDFANQVNNSLGFPGIFRGALDVRARTITDGMCFAAAEELAACVEDRLDEHHILPGMDDWWLFPREAVAVALRAQEEGVARLTKDREELHAEALSIVRRVRDVTHLLMEEGHIALPPEG
jgi:malate dehydrogenase (oxaloacetate-decarboxylating)